MATTRPAPLAPAMRQLVQRMARASAPPLYTLTPAQAKAAYAASAEILELPRPELAQVQDLHFSNRDDVRLPLRIYRPTVARPAPALLFFHGGGFVVGSVATHDVLCRKLAQGSGAVVVSVGYRLAPAHRFPAAVHDAEDALSWLHRQGGALGLDTERLAVGGDSAGGTLAAVTALRARALGIGLALQLLIYPGTCAHQDTGSHLAYADGPILGQRLVQWFFDQYIDADQREDWRFAPLLADDVSGVAPAWLALAECDPLFDEGLAYADKLRMAQVPVDLQVYRGMTHAFVQMGRALEPARRFHADAAAVLRQALTSPVS